MILIRITIVPNDPQILPPHLLIGASYASDPTPLVFSGLGLSSVEEGREDNEVVQDLESLSLSIYSNGESKNDTLLATHRARRDTSELSGRIMGLSEQEFSAAIHAPELKFASSIHSEKYTMQEGEFRDNFYRNELSLNQYYQRVEQVISFEVARMENDKTFSSSGEYLCQLYAILTALCSSNQECEGDELWQLKK